MKNRKIQPTTGYYIQSLYTLPTKTNKPTTKKNTQDPNGNSSNKGERGEENKYLKI